MEALAIEIDDCDQNSSCHASWHRKVLTGTPKRIGMNNRDTTVSYRQQATKLHEYHRDVARWSPSIILLVKGRNVGTY